MKKIILLLTLTTFILLDSCSKKLYPETAEATITGGTENGTVSISAYGYANNTEAAELDAFRTALNTLFYIGFPDNSYVGDLKKPFFDKEPNTESEFFKNFYESKKFLTYVTSQKKAEIVKDRAAAKYSNTKGKTCVRKEMTINYKSLRKYFEDQNVLRKGFSY
jgi:uncharacterized short protein YbdD (DUF466 family)